MDVLTTVAEVRERLGDARCGGARVGFVPTMGYLHDGHLSLVERAVAENDVTVVSVYINPLQFAPHEDLASYPRDLGRDAALCEAAGADLVFAPGVEEMAPEPILTTVSVAEVTAPLEGEHRPTHLGGVTTIVAKLFAIIGPCRAYFGEKDWQQLVTVRRMASDLAMPVEVVGVPTVREPDGLAMSSRNVYLDPAEREVAPTLRRALEAGAAAIEAGERDPVAVEAVMAEVVAAEPGFAVDYVAAREAETLRVADPLHGDVRLLVAARLGKARLIDNLGVRVAS